MVEKATQIQCLKATTPWWPRRVNRAEVRKERGGINCREEAQKDGTRAEVLRSLGFFRKGSDSRGGAEGGRGTRRAT